MARESSEPTALSAVDTAAVTLAATPTPAIAARAAEQDTYHRTARKVYKMGSWNQNIPSKMMGCVKIITHVGDVLDSKHYRPMVQK